MQLQALRIICILAALVVAASTTAGPSSPEADSWTLHLTAPRPDLRRAEGGGGLLPSIEGFGTSDRPGEPALPVRIFLVAIPEGSVPDLRIVRAASDSLVGLDLAPVPRLRQADRGEGDVAGGGTDPSLAAEQVRGAGSGAPEYRADPRIFNQDREFPDAPVRLGEIGYLRQQRFVEVIFQPLVYNPVRHQARLFHDMEIEVRFASPEGRSAVSPARPDRHFEAVYRRSLVNYEQGRRFRVARGGAAAAGPGRAAGGRTTAEAAAAAPVSATAQAGVPRYKLLVSQPGIYRLDYDYLNANAADLVNDVTFGDPRTWRLEVDGVEVPISIRTAAGASGEADGSLDPGDFVEFVGRPKSEPPTVLNYDFQTTFPDIYQANDFTDVQVYWLSSEGLPGSHPRIPGVDGAPAMPGFAVADDFAATAVWDENTIYLPLADADPFFSIPSLLAGSTQAQRDLSLPLPGLAGTSAPADLLVRLRGGSNLPAAPDHLTRVWLNNDSGAAVDFTWDGEVIHEEPLAVPQTDLTDPTIVHLRAPGVTVDRQYIDTVTVTYRRLFEAVGDRLAFAYPNQDVRFEVSGFSDPQATIYETSRDLGNGEADPILITGAAVTGGGSLTYSFEVPLDTDPMAPATRTFETAGPAGLRLPDQILPASDPVLAGADNEADLIVIAASDTVDAAPGGALDALLAHRLATQGLSSRVVFIDQIYDEFGAGRRDVEAIRAFLGYAFDNWVGANGTADPPSYVLLVGDATPDYENTLQRTDWVDQVPTPMMFHVNSTLGYYSSDNWLASFRGPDQLADVHLGRISARSVAEADAVFDKIRMYEQAPPPGLWKGRAVMLAGDGAFVTEADGFEAIQQGVIDDHFSQPPYSADPLFYDNPPWNSNDIPGFKTAITNSVNQGAVFMSYVGHGSFDTYGRNAAFFTSLDAALLGNDGPLPFMVNVNCLAGGFHYFLPEGSLGEAMVNNPTGGAIAAVAPAGLSNTVIGDVISDELVDLLFGSLERRELGPAMTSLRTALWNRPSILDLQSYTFLGDPATILAMPAPPPPSALGATAGNGEVTLAWTAPALPVDGYRIYRAAGSPAGSYLPIACDPLTATSCVDSGAANATRYYYYAVSLDAEGFEGPASNLNDDCDTGPGCVTALPLNPGPPSIPTGLSAQDAGIGGALLVTWNANPENDLKNYTLYYGDQPGSRPLSVNTAPTATSLLLGGLSGGIRYYMVLTATNTSLHESAETPIEVSAVPHLIQGIAPPMAIADLSLAKQGEDLALDWSRPTVDIYGRPTTVMGYEVHRSPTAGFIPSPASLIASIGDGDTTSYVDPGGATGPATSYYLIIAFDMLGNMSGAGRELPNGISDLSVTMISADDFGLTWSAVTTDLQGLPTIIDHYQVHVTDTPVGRESLDGTTLWLDNVTNLSIQVTLPATPRYISVLAVDNRGNLSPY